MVKNVKSIAVCYTTKINTIFVLKIIKKNEYNQRDIL